MTIKKYSDKHRISYKCNRKPDSGSGLTGFEADKYYVGRSFNGLIEVSADWGRGNPSILLDYKRFNRYFEVLQSEEAVRLE